MMHCGPGCKSKKISTSKTMFLSGSIRSVALSERLLLSSRQPPRVPLSSMCSLSLCGHSQRKSQAVIFKVYAKSAESSHSRWKGKERSEREIKKSDWTMVACVRLPGIRLATIYATSRTIRPPSVSLLHPPSSFDDDTPTSIPSPICWLTMTRSRDILSREHTQKK